MRFPLALVFVFAIFSAARADEAPSAFYIDVQGTPADVVAVKLLNSALNRISLGKQLMAVAPANVQNGIVSLDLKTLFSDEQRRVLAKLVPGPGRPLPLWALLEALNGPMAAELDGIYTKGDLERVAGFSEAKEMKAPDAKGKGIRETFLKQSDLKIFVRRLHPEKAGSPATPAFEQWILTMPNGTVREYFFGTDGKRLVVPPDGVASGGRAAIERRLAELKRSRTGFGLSREWYAIHDLARRADMGSNAASDELIKKYLADDKKRRESLPTPTVTAIPQTLGVSPATVSKDMPADETETAAKSTVPPPPMPSPASAPARLPESTPAGKPPAPPQ